MPDQPSIDDGGDGADVTVLVPGEEAPENNEENEVALQMEYWQERLYKSVDTYDMDAKFYENMGKSQHLEGKMSAREMTFAKGGGLPTVMPLPANQGTPQNP